MQCCELDYVQYSLSLAEALNSSERHSNPSPKKGKDILHMHIVKTPACSAPPRENLSRNPAGCLPSPLQSSIRGFAVWYLFT